MLQKTRFKIVLFLTVAVFLGCLGFGLWLAEHKAVWNDEVHSQVASVMNGGYKDILFLGAGNSIEGNIAPLFYLIQRAICDVAGFRSPVSWDAHSEWTDETSKIVLRINPNIFMSLSAAMIFYFFGRNYSLWTAGYSFFVFLSSYIVLAFWAEARPYALWIFLTTAQNLLFLMIMRQENTVRHLWRWLTAVHILMAFTVIFSLFQILGVSLVLWLMKNRKIRDYIFMTIVPVLICFVYYFYSPKFQFWFEDGPLALLSASLPKDRMFIIFFYAIVWAIYSLRNKVPSLKLCDLKGTREGCGFLAVTTLMVLAAIFVLAIFQIKASSKYVGFQISNRYFVFLGPVGIQGHKE
jgi:hypothetical protein